MASIQRVKVNFTIVEQAGLKVWYSYDTPIAFQVEGGYFASRENRWGPTTGKHLGIARSGFSHAPLSEEQFLRELAVYDKS